MNIALLVNRHKPQAEMIKKEVRDFLLQRGAHLFTEEEDAAELGIEPLSAIDPKKIDFMISLGGDGTLLRIIHRHPAIHAPVLGINLGSLGFLADIPVADIYPSLGDLMAGHYTIQERLMIEGTTKEKTAFAVNDIVIHRSQNPFLVDLILHVDGSYLNTFSADGMIIATPCGSTAYSLSAGGPIVSPDLKALVLTPICPHAISNRPIVLLPKQQIQVQYISKQAPIEVTYDSTTPTRLATDEILSVKISSRSFRFVALKRHDYFSTLRTKLGWTGKLKPL